MLARGQVRLDMAAALLAAPVHDGGLGRSVSAQPSESLQAATLRTLNSLNPIDRERIKSLVDWVEAYELGTPIAPVPLSKKSRPVRPIITRPALNLSASDWMGVETDDCSEDAVWQALASVGVEIEDGRAPVARERMRSS
jgi:hypothetical protein